jgi:hypothetical protein
MSDIPHAELGDFRRLTVDLYIPAGGTGYWEGAIRRPDDEVRNDLRACITNREPFTIELLYGDQEGGQRRVSRYSVLPHSEDGWYCQSGRHWNIDRPDPR